MPKRTATMNHHELQKIQDGKKIGLNIVSRGVSWETIGKKMVAEIEERRKIIIELDIEIGDVIDRGYGRINTVLGFTNDFLLIFEKGDRIDPRTILILEFKIIKK